MEGWLEDNWQATVIGKDSWVLCAEPVDVKVALEKEE